MGMYVELWHAAAMELKKMMCRASDSKEVIEAFDTVIERCKGYSMWKRKLAIPMIKSLLPEHRIYGAQTDIFIIFEKTFIVCVAECILWRLVEGLSGKTADEWITFVFRISIAYFGQIAFLVTDQQGAITSDLVGMCCVKVNIALDFETRKGMRQLLLQRGGSRLSGRELRRRGPPSSSRVPTRRKATWSARWPCLPTAC
eukprot:750312-Pyramimonas_sp.AAC.1